MTINVLSEYQLTQLKDIFNNKIVHKMGVDRENTTVLIEYQSGWPLSEMQTKLIPREDPNYDKQV